MPTTTLALLLLVLPGPVQEPAPRVEAPALREVLLEGSALERGRTHGRLLRAEIADLLARWRADLERTHGVPAERFLAAFLAATDHRAAIERWTPELLEEVRGLAEGAGVDADTMLAFQLFDELWAVGGRVRLDKCTAIGVPAAGGAPTLLAQNLDVPRWLHAYPTVLRIRPEQGPEALVTTVPGLIGANGVNEEGVGVLVTTLLQLAPTLDGLPVAFVVRGVLARRSREEAVGFLRAVQHASGQSYTVGDPRGASCHECSGRSVVPFAPRPETGVTFHTNHPLASRDWNPDYLVRCEAAGVAPERGLRSCGRLATLEAALGPRTVPGIEELARLLGSRDAPGDSIANPSTYLCTVFVLEPGAPRALISPGPPDRAAFEELGFER